jgi:DNA-binding MarR family transcriptional regulator
MSYANDMGRTLMKTRVTRADLELAGALRISVMRMSRRLRNQRTDHSVSITQLAVLGTLTRHGTPMTPRELADHEKIQPPSMTRILAALEEKGLIQRTGHPTDGRQVLVALTDTARAMIDEDRRRREAWLNLRLAELTPQERATLRAAAPILERLAQS